MSSAPEVSINGFSFGSSSSSSSSDREALRQRNNRILQRNSNVDLNPCVDEQRLSMHCLAEHDYRKDACQKYFDNYNQCNRFWNQIRQQRRMAGEQPELPAADERARILDEKRRKDEQLVRRIQEERQLRQQQRQQQKPQP